MSWLRRIARSPGPAVAAPTDAASEAGVGAAPGAAALLEGIRQDGSHAILDLGPASESSLSVYGRFARRIRFADLLGGGAGPLRRGSMADRLSLLPAQPEQPYDVVFAWDVLDRLFAEDHPRLISRLAEVTAPNARLHLLVRAPEHDTLRPLHFALLDLGRVRHEPTSPLRFPRTGMRPADIAPLLAPFRIAHAFTLKGGMREYVAVRKNA